MFNNCITGY